MTRAIRMLALSVLLVVSAGAATGQDRTERPSAAAQAAIVAVIRDQMAAFLRDDGTAAFAHASPTIRAAS